MVVDNDTKLCSKLDRGTRSYIERGLRWRHSFSCIISFASYHYSGSTHKFSTAPSSTPLSFRRIPTTLHLLHVEVTESSHSLHLGLPRLCWSRFFQTPGLNPPTTKLPIARRSPYNLSHFNEMLLSHTRTQIYWDQHDKKDDERDYKEATRYMPHATCHTLHTTRYTLHATCHMPHATCHMLHATPHMLHATPCTPQ
jgi:hypothetical protein